MRTIETNKTRVEIIVWPSNRTWNSRYATSCQIGAESCTLILTEEVFRDPKRANTAYKRFAHRMRSVGLMPPNVLFRHMSSAISRDTFCLLSPSQSLFNTACPLGRLSLMNIGEDSKRMLCAISTPESAA